jgi:choline dehydrogenase
MEELTVAQAAFVNAGVRSGLPFADDLDDLEAGTGIGPMPVNIAGSIRWNAAFAFLDPVRGRPNLRIAGRTQARRVLVSHGSVTGVEVTDPEGRTAAIGARRVIVAAGAYHSPALLQRSGIGPADQLRGLGLDVIADLPGVGQHLLDHACVELDFAGRPGLAEELAAQAWHPDEQTVGRARSSRCDGGPYDIHLFMVAGANSGHPGLPPISLYGGAMRAVSAGQVTIGSPDPHASPRVDHRYGTDPGGHDRAVLAEALQLLRDITRDHDATGAVHGLAGLYVCDASIMPDITRGNINLPTAMIGARVAAGLAGLDPARAAARSAAPA